MAKKNSSTQSKLIADFHGKKLSIVKHNNEPHVSAKEISEAMGLAWKPQYTKLNSNRKRWGVTKMVIPSNGGKQVAVGMPLRKLPAWLATIQVNKLSNEVKPVIIQYQEECDNVLWEYWNRSNQSTPKNNPDLLILHKSVLDHTGSAIVTIEDGIQKARPVQPQAKHYITTIVDGEAPKQVAITRENLERLIREEMPEYTLVDTRAFSKDIRPIQDALTQAVDIWSKTDTHMQKRVQKLEKLN